MGYFINDCELTSLSLVSLMQEKDRGLLSELHPHEDELVPPGEGFLSSIGGHSNDQETNLRII